MPPQIACASALPGKTGKRENHVFTQLDCVTRTIHLCVVFPVTKYTLNHKKRDIIFLTITLANLNRFYSFYIILIAKKFYIRL